MNRLKAVTLEELEVELKSRYKELRASSPNASYRELAKRMDISYSTLFRVLRGERRLGKLLARQIASQFGLTLIEGPLTRRTHPSAVLSDMDSAVASEIHWLGLAILESIKLRDFQPSTAWLSSKFGLPLGTIEDACRRLEANRMLSRSDERWIDLASDVSSRATSAQSAAAIRAVLVEVIELAERSVTNVNFEERHHSFALLPASRDLLPEIRKRCYKFQRELNRYIKTKSSKNDQVYAIYSSFFPLTGSASNEYE